MNHRKYVGPVDRFDLSASNQFNIMTALGLREHHHLLDIGCGCLRGGRLFIAYLQAWHYFGLEPDEEVLEAGIENEASRGLIELKSPTFDHNAAFYLGGFGCKFDYILAQSIFSHAAREQVEACLCSAREVMHDSSLFAATFMRGDRDYADQKWVYPDVVQYTPDFMRDAAIRAGLECVIFNWQHPGGQKWCVFTDPANVHERASGKVISIKRDGGRPLEVFGGK